MSMWVKDFDQQLSPDGGFRWNKDFLSKISLEIFLGEIKIFNSNTDVWGRGCAPNSIIRKASDIIFVKFFTPAQFQDFENLPEKSA